MPDRASQLAKQILERTSALEKILSDEGAVSAAQKDRRREEAIAKVLAIYAGVTDGASIRLVASAVPTLSSRRELPDRERDEFAAFLRERIRFD